MRRPTGYLPSVAISRPERLLEAYRHGIFPWYNEGQPILWWSPDPRTVLFPEHLHISRSLKRSLRPGHFTVTLDRCFRDDRATLRGAATAVSGRRNLDHAGHDGGLYRTP